MTKQRVIGTILGLLVLRKLYINMHVSCSTDPNWTPFFFFCYQQFFILFFSHITQHNIQNITKQNNRHILNISRSNQKGGREGRTIKTQHHSFIQSRISIKKHCQASMVEGLTPPTRAVVHSHVTICRRLRIQYVFLHMCGVYWTPFLRLLHSKSNLVSWHKRTWG